MRWRPSQGTQSLPPSIPTFSSINLVRGSPPSQKESQRLAGEHDSNQHDQVGEYCFVIGSYLHVLRQHDLRPTPEMPPKRPTVSHLPQTSSSSIGKTLTANDLASTADARYVSSVALRDNSALNPGILIMCLHLANQ